MLPHSLAISLQADQRRVPELFRGALECYPLDRERQLLKPDPVPTEASARI